MIIYGIKSKYRGERNEKEVYECAVQEFNTMVERLNPTKVLVYGNIFPFMDGVEVERIEKFTEKRWADA